MHTEATLTSLVLSFVTWIAIVSAGGREQQGELVDATRLKSVSELSPILLIDLVNYNASALLDLWLYCVVFVGGKC